MDNMIVNQRNMHIVDSDQRDSRMWDAAQSLEANFLSEVLKSSGFGKSRQMLGGGAGEDQFSSLLVSEYAAATVAAGGIGLAESLYHSIVQSSGAYF